MSYKWLDLVAVQISMHTHYFNSWTQVFQVVLAFIRWHTVINIVVLFIYKYTDCCYGKGSQSSPQCYYSITNKTICNCLWITTMRLGNHHHDFIMNIVSLKTARFTKTFTGGIIYSVISWISWWSNIIRTLFLMKMRVFHHKHLGTLCARGQNIQKFLLNRRGTANIVFLVYVLLTGFSRDCIRWISALSRSCTDLAEAPRFLLPRPRADILPVRPSHSVDKIYLEVPLSQLDRNVQSFLLKFYWDGRLSSWDVSACISSNACMHYISVWRSDDWVEYQNHSKQQLTWRSPMVHSPIRSDDFLCWSPPSAAFEHWSIHSPEVPCDVSKR